MEVLEALLNVYFCVSGAGNEVSWFIALTY